MSLVVFQKILFESLVVAIHVRWKLLCLQLIGSISIANDLEELEANSISMTDFIFPLLKYKYLYTY